MNNIRKQKTLSGRYSKLSSKSEYIESSLLTQQPLISNYKKNETNLFSNSFVGSKLDLEASYGGVGLVAKPLGFIVKEQREYSNNNLKNNFGSNEKTNPYGIRKRYQTKFITNSGQTIIVDSFKARQQRLTTTIHSFVDYIKPIAELENWSMKMITLTYKNSEDWKPHHMGKFTKWLKRNLGDSLKSYAWVAELQERGAMHYHLIAYVSKETNIPFPDKAYGNKNFVGWPYGHSKVENARVGQYLASYVSKEHQKDYYRFPKGARGFSIYVSSSVELKRLFKAYMNDKKKPLWITSDFPNIDFLSNETSFKKIGGKWRIGNETLTKLNMPKNFTLEGSKIRVNVPIKKRIKYKKIDTFSFDSIKLKTLKEVMPLYLEELNIWYEKGGWVLNEELLESSVSFDSCQKIDGSTWVAELMAKSSKKFDPKIDKTTEYEKTANESKLNQAIIKAKWESYKT